MRNHLSAVLAAGLLAASLPCRAEVISVPPRDAAALIAAIEHANRAPGEDVIELAPGSLYAIATPQAERAVALPVIRSRIRILGNRAEIRGYASRPMALFEVSDSGRLRLELLTLAEGTRGALINRGKVELEQVSVVDNSALDTEAIIANYGTLEARRCLIGYNQIAGAQRDAGIVVNFGTLALTDTRLADNSVSRRYDAVVAASGVLNFGEAQLTRVGVDAAVQEPAPDQAPQALVALGNGRFVSVDVQAVAATP